MVSAQEKIKEQSLTWRLSTYKPRFLKRKGVLLFFRFRELFLFLLSSEDNRVAELESTLEEVKIQRDLAEREENQQSNKCKALETQTKELKTKLQSSELEVNELLHKCENLEAQLQQLRTAVRDANLENSSQLDQRNNKAEG